MAVDNLITLESQTYFGALDGFSGRCLLSRHSKADTPKTIAFVEHLLAQNKKAKIVFIWDGASYHRFSNGEIIWLKSTRREDWKVHCLRLAPYAPSRKSP